MYRLGESTIDFKVIQITICSKIRKFEDSQINLVDFSSDFMKFGPVPTQKWPS